MLEVQAGLDQFRESRGSIVVGSSSPVHRAKRRKIAIFSTIRAAYFGSAERDRGAELSIPPLSFEASKHFARQAGNATKGDRAWAVGAGLGGRPPRKIEDESGRPRRKPRAFARREYLSIGYGSGQVKTVLAWVTAVN